MSRSRPVVPAAALPGPLALARSVARSRAPVRLELALDDPPVRRFMNVCVAREDKEAMDAVQSWYSFRQARRVPHWELYNLVIAEALENPGGRFYRMSSRSWV